MTCIGCDSTGYRKICNYDRHTTCNKNYMLPIQLKSYQCFGSGYGSGNNDKSCVQMNAPPGHGRYQSIQECQQNCGGEKGPPVQGFHPTRGGRGVRTISGSQYTPPIYTGIY
jgi:hypothetical protein